MSLIWICFDVTNTRQVVLILVWDYNEPETVLSLSCSALSKLTCAWSVSPSWIEFQLLGRSLLTDLYLLARIPPNPLRC